MAKSKNCSGNEPKTPVCLFIEDLEKKKTVNKEQRATSRIRRESWETLRGYALCTLDNTEKTHQYFRDMSNFELLDMQDSAKIIASYVDTTVTIDSALAKNIAEASKLLVDLQNKLHEANNAACTMRNCLISHLDLDDSQASDKPVEQKLKSVTEAAKCLSDDGKTAAEAMVNVAGIHTFSNVEKLQSHARLLVKNVDDLKAWTDSLVASAMNDVKTAQAELDQVHLKLNQEEFGYFHSISSLNAVIGTRNVICSDDPCRSIDCVEKICTKLGEEEKDCGSPPADDFSQGDKD